MHCRFMLWIEYGKAFGIKTMDQAEFQDWLSASDRLTAAQRAEAARALSTDADEERSVAAVERSVGESRICPRCGEGGAVRKGRTRGLWRYLCKSCGRTFNAVTGTPLQGLHKKERWLSFGESLAEGETVGASARRCDIAPSTAFRWRHRFLDASRQDPEMLRGIVEADETYLLRSRKGERNMVRPPRRRGGKAKTRGLSKDLAPVLFAADRSGATLGAALDSTRAAEIADALRPAVAKDAVLAGDAASCYPPCARSLGLSHVALNQSAGPRIRGPYHIQTVGNRQSRFKGFLFHFRGVATKYLGNYLQWYQLACLDQNASPSTCLGAAVNSACIRIEK